jgi:Tfp pilus assembly protein PilV
MRRCNKMGTTLVEAMIAMVFATVISAGLYQVGWKARRYAEYSRLANEARSRAKEQLEEIISYRLSDLRQVSYQWRSETNTSSAGFSIVRTPRVVWHARDLSVVGASSGVYAEVHVDVVFRSPLWERLMTNTFSMIIE